MNSHTQFAPLKIPQSYHRLTKTQEKNIAAVPDPEDKERPLDSAQHCQTTLPTSFEALQSPLP